MTRFAPIDEILPVRVVQARKGLGSFVTLDLEAGQDSYLWIYLCDWVLRIDNFDVLSSDSVTEENAGIFLDLRGRKLVSVLETEEGVELRFSGGELFILSNNRGEYDDEDDFFVLYLPSKTISFSKENGFYVEPRSA